MLLVATDRKNPTFTVNNNIGRVHSADVSLVYGYGLTCDFK